MSEHTPGPWLYVPRAGGYSITGDGGRVVLCDDEQYYPTAPPERDARLIAAAPDLLAALREMATCACGWKDTGGAECKHEKAANAAIDKATGR